MIDSHCHLSYDPLSTQIDAVLHRARTVGVSGMITIGTTIADSRRAVELCRNHAEIRCAVGIHPHHAAEAIEADFAALSELEKEPRVVALGEMGLDYHYDFSPRDRQREVFRRQMELAGETGRPVVIHCREAFDDCLDIMKHFPNLPAIFHCFTDNRHQARRVLDRGYLLGFTGVVTFKKSDELREVARFVPADRFVLETDAPYLAPEPFRRQKVNEPAMLIHTADAIARLRGAGREEIERLTTANVKRFFGTLKGDTGDRVICGA